MKSKKQFTFNEVCKIHFLSRQLGRLQERHADQSEQKKVRDKLRKLGFFINDYK